MPTFLKKCSWIAICLTGLPMPSGALSTLRRPFRSKQTLVVVRSDANAPERAAVDLLLEEEKARTGQSWTLHRGGIASLSGASEDRLLLVIAEVSQVDQLLPVTLRDAWARESPSPAFRTRTEGFTVRTFRDGGRVVLIVAGNDSRGVLYGVGYLLRHMELSEGRTVLAQPLSLTSAPEYPIRSHQIGYRYKNNTYDAWTLPMFEQHIRDLAVFGISGLQVIAPVSDDRATSPLYPAPALETVVGISRLLDKYGLDCELYYPEMRKDYTDPALVEAELKDFESLVKAMPRIDALYVPGGDPGHTAPGPLLNLVERESEVLHRYHPKATIWISAQGFDRSSFEEFYALLKEGQPSWLTGVFFGPQSRDSFETQRAKIPARYRMLFYPDIGHTMHAQFPVPEWDPVFALTEGREPIDPRPVDETKIYRHFAHLHTGFVTYSEGVNDDVNKFLWTRLGWSGHTDPHETLEDYSRYFLGPRIGRDPSTRFADAVFTLEQGWRGPLATNRQIPRTLSLLQQLESEASPKQRNNWRFESALYRATYDALLQQRLLVESQQERSAIAMLSSAAETGSTAAMDAASAALQSPPADSELRGQLEDLANRLFAHARLQLSVSKFGASGVERGANLDHADIPLNDRVWLERRFAEIRRLSGEKQRLEAIAEIVNWEHPANGAIYDDLGMPGKEPHLVRGQGFDADPEMYETAIDGIADRTTEDGWRLSELDYAETLYEYPLEMRYTGLNPHKRYRLRITYAGEDYTLPLKLVANGTLVVHPARLRKSNPETVEFELPSAATLNGTLDLRWDRPDGVGGGGRGRQVAEVWLIPSR
ncbi:hypothetical protein SAMN05421819_1131 [Bryocella elongata]|uniref:Uncharacterized protein n=1 Tax=Bryocella elongata TaxID=863522 RepID=A0A1H5UQ78_9BACT|nr:hypothetical protein SAMN05421819_1131 [Bryocella elongata]